MQPVSMKNDPHYIWRLKITEDNAEGMDVMKTIHKVNAKFLNTRLWQMLILFKHSLQAATFTFQIYDKIYKKIDTCVLYKWQVTSFVC